MDDVTRRLRDANPYASDELSPRALQVLDDITSGRRRPSEPQTSRGSVRQLRWLSGAVAASAFTLVAILIAVVSGVLIAPHPAAAVTPMPLTLRATDRTVDALRDALETAEPAVGPPSERGAAWEGWYLQLDAEHAEWTFIQPQRVRIDWRDDLSGSTRIVAGTPVDRHGEALTAPSDDGARPGSVISEMAYGHGEFFSPFPDDPPETADAMHSYLDVYLDTDVSSSKERTAADYAFAVLTLVQFWTLSDAAQRAAIEVILAASGAQVEGTTTDRAGREGIVLDIGSLESAPFHRDQLVIDPAAWHILAHEQIYLGGLDDPMLPPAGAVTQYTLWR